MQKPFSWNVKVSSYDTDMNAVLSPQNMVKYLMETAIEHTEDAGYPVEKLLEMKRGWVVLNWIIKVDKYPEYRDNLEIQTWAKYGSTLQATRYFKVYCQGEAIAAAASRWAFLDLEKRHPVRFSEEMEDAYCCDLPAPFDPGRFALPAEKAEYLASEKSLVVRRSETDTNGHTNNTRYVEWAVDDVPDDVYSSYMPSEINVLYRKECRAGDDVDVKTYIRDIDENNKEIITTISDTNGGVLCKTATLWHRK